MARIPLMTQANGMPAVPTWKPSTAYKAGQLVSFGTDLYLAKANFTSGASFSATNWNLVASGTYAPKDATAWVEGNAAFARPADLPRPVYLRADDFAIGAGGPTKTVAGSRDPVWTFRHLNGDRINATWLLPRGTTKVDIDVIWANTSATLSGNVAFRAYVGSHTVGDGVSGIITGSIVSAPADPLQHEIRRTRVMSQVDVTGAMTPLIMLDRLGSDGSDTLTADIEVMGILITPTPTYPGILTDDGSWCWFNQPRLLAYQGTKNQVYAGYVTADGSTGVASLNTTTKATASFVLHAKLQQDDHDTPGLVVRPDGKLMAFYTRHSIVDDPIYFRVSTSAEDVTAWGTETTITLPSGAQPCYPKPVYVGSRLYVFFRNVLYADFIYSDDDGATWSAPATLFQWSTGWRGYVNFAANGARIDFICNDDNPNTSSNCNLYHCYLQGGNLYKTDGTLIGALGTAVTTGQLTKIYDYTTRGDAWGWDVQLDATGKPVVVFATFPGGSTATAADTDHRYHYARWTGSAWVRTELPVSGGPAFIDRGSEYRYSGGISVLSSDTSVVYLSRLVSGQYEIERWTTSDQGATWTSTPVTVHSPEKQVRPTTPAKHFAGAPEVAWMSGWYVNFTKFATRLIYRP